MKCPHCDYKSGWDKKLLRNVEGDSGDFYELPVKLERENYYQDTVKLYGCPSCKKTFIE